MSDAAPPKQCPYAKHKKNLSIDPVSPKGSAKRPSLSPVRYKVQSFTAQGSTEEDEANARAQKKRRIAMVERRKEPLNYTEYLRLDKLLSAQEPVSGEGKDAAHDEHLFIITHQVYELWFKQILHDLDWVRDAFVSPYVQEKMVGQSVERLRRITNIQHMMLTQLDVLETMTPMNFLDFRDFLFPASGFQSAQFRLVENKLGLTPNNRMKYSGRGYCSYLMAKDAEVVHASEGEQSLLALVEAWLERTPFLNMGGASFWRSYEQAVDRMFEKDRNFVRSQPGSSSEMVEKQLEELTESRTKFDAILHKDKYEALRERGDFQFSHTAMQAALLIMLYQDEPILRMAHDLLLCLLNIDEQLAIWRYRHSLLAHRMLGLKMGTGGSSGYAYLRATAVQHRVFKDLFNMASFLIPRTELPPLSTDMQQALTFSSESVVGNDGNEEEETKP